MIRPSVLFLILFTCLGTNAQISRYIIKFNNKGLNSYVVSNPSLFLTQRAIDRRLRYNINIDSTDLPITESYIDSIRLSGNVSILNKSKWLNQIAISTNDIQALAKINSFSFVEQTQAIAAKSYLPVKNKTELENTTPISNSNITARETSADFYNYGTSAKQIEIHQGEFLHNHGFKGNGMQLAVIDAGFYHYNTLPTFDSIRSHNQILGTWDFVSNNADVSNDDNHGMKCLSAIAANLPGVFIGTAPQASFYLFRSEDINSEYPIEEHNLAAATEKADSLGVDICSISLGYNTFDSSIFDYTYNDMNGNKTISARAVNYAAKKGLLMVVSAGNEGDNSWHYILTPGDADSAFTIGAVDSTGIIGAFSGYGPNSNNQIKPSAVAIGENAVVANSSTGMPMFSNGTSFACPNMAGITTCLWQAFPEASNMEIIKTLEQSASIANTPNNRMGYGIPDAKKAFVMLQKKYFSKQINFNQCKAILDLSIKTDNTMTIEIERKLSSDNNDTIITTLSNNDQYGWHTFHYIDDLYGLDITKANYRFKVSIGTDTSYYIDSAEINYDISCNPNLEQHNNIRISPNPVSTTLNIEIDRINKTAIEVVIQNNLGQTVFTKNYTQDAGVAINNINLSHLSKGIYYIQVYADHEKILTKKFVKL